MKFFKIFSRIFLVLVLLLLIFYLYVSTKFSNNQRAMNEYVPKNTDLEIKEKRLEMSFQEKLFCDSIKSLGLNECAILHDIEYIEEDSMLEIKDRKFTVYYRRKFSDKPITLDSIEKFRTELVKKLFSIYISDSTFNEHDRYYFSYGFHHNDVISYSKKEILALTNTKLVRGKDNALRRVPKK